MALEEKLEVMAVHLEAMAAQLATAREQFRVLREQVQALGGRDAGSGPNAAGHVDLSSAVSPSSSSTPERCHPEDVLLHIRVKRVGKSTAAAGRAAADHEGHLQGRV